MGWTAQGFIDINGLPLLACLAVSGILVYLGMHVVQRKVIFVDLALAQIAAFGVMWAILMGYDHEHDTLAVTLYSLAFTIAGAFIFSITRTRHESVPHEAIIGIIYVTATAAGLVLSDRFALGTEAMKELVAGRVALVTWPIFVKLVVACAIVGVFHLMLYRRFLRISEDPDAAEADRINLRLWDFLFYVSFGFLITQAVGILGVLPVFAYLVIPAVAAAFLFESVRARLLFGWGFAAVVSLVGLETARTFGMDPGPTIVCLFAAVLILVGVWIYLRKYAYSARAIVRVVGLTALFGAFVLGTLQFEKRAATDELAQAMMFARSDDVAELRKAMQSFRRFPDARERWQPLVVEMLDHPDQIAREEAIKLLGEGTDRSVVPRLAKMLDAEVEEDDGVRELVVETLRHLHEPTVAVALVAAAQNEPEQDIAVEMCEAAFETGEVEQAESLRAAVDLLFELIADEGGPRAARRDALEHLRQHVEHPSDAREPAELARWWTEHRDQLRWDHDTRLFRMPAAALEPSE